MDIEFRIAELPKKKFLDQHEVWFFYWKLFQDGSLTGKFPNHFKQIEEVTSILSNLFQKMEEGTLSISC